MVTNLARMLRMPMIRAIYIFPISTKKEKTAAKFRKIVTFMLYLHAF